MAVVKQVIGSGEADAGRQDWPQFGGGRFGAETRGRRRQEAAQTAVNRQANRVNDKTVFLLAVVWN